MPSGIHWIYLLKKIKHATEAAGWRMNLIKSRFLTKWNQEKWVFNSLASSVEHHQAGLKYLHLDRPEPLNILLFVRVCVHFPPSLTPRDVPHLAEHVQ